MWMWVEQRLGVNEILNKPWIPRGIAMWSYFPGVMLVVLAIWQAASGLWLAPSYPGGLQVDNRVQYPLLLNAHRWGAELMTVMAVIYLAAKLYTASYTRQRELTWLTTLLLVTLLLVSVHTGAMLPSSTDGQANLQMMKQLGAAIGLVSSQPDTSRSAQIFAVSRLYVWHIALLPFLLALACSAHMALGVRQKQRHS